MDKYEAMLKLLQDVIASGPIQTGNATDGLVPVGISNRHVHLSKIDHEVLFGADCSLSKTKDLSQPGQYACNECVTICGPKGAVEKVRILGPLRPQTQVEVMAGDCVKLGIPVTVRLSGDLTGTPGLTIIGPKGSVQIPEGAIVAQRHIHMLPDEAYQFGVADGQIVSIQYDENRGGIYHNVVVRATKTSALECHLDIEEANAMGIHSKSKVKIIK
jgi:propanediol utilization protein